VSKSPDSKNQAEVARALRAQLAMATGGLAPEDYLNAWWDWYLNLAKQPDKQSQILQDALSKAADNWSFAVRAASGAPLSPATGDARFGSETWNQWPFNIYAHNYLNVVDWWQKAWSTVPGVASNNARTLDFMGRNIHESFSPANYLTTNPELLETTRAEAGENLVRGFKNWLEDAERAIDGKRAVATTKYVVGRDVAATPGKVILRNDLVELIQYSPTTEKVYAEPVLIIPAWIMKYYILDLSPHNSLVRYLVSQGHSVFMVSWKNPTGSDRALGMDDYLKLGIHTALEAVAKTVPGPAIHAVGYCIGGTLLSIAAASLAGERKKQLASMTLLAAQQDFSEAGELSVFISPNQLDMLEAVMSRNGFRCCAPVSCCGLRRSMPTFAASANRKMT
jgi:polyhydroxyalkanoate synthase